MLLLILEALYFLSSMTKYIFKEIYMVQYHRIPLTAGKRKYGYREPSCHPKGA